MDYNTEDVNSENFDEGICDTQNLERISFDQEENTVNSNDAADVSRDSADSETDDKGEKSDSFLAKPTFKSILQAKKRLQAYSFTKVAKKLIKDEKNDDGEKNEKNTPKKPKKEQPLDRAKAVMEEIEEIKRQEMRDEMVKQELIAAKVKLIQASRRSRSRSVSPGKDRHFKKREIKSRNYRRTDSSNRKSASPDDRRRSSARRASPGPVYPKNWTEYVQQNMTVKKNIDLKLKLFPAKKHRPYEMFKKSYNFSTPPPVIEPFKYLALNTEMRETPQSFLRYTKASPTVPFNVNFKNVKEGFMSRPQLFSIIPYNRRQMLEKLFSLSKPLSTSKKLKTREWYSKSWKSKMDADCKILENSVGLSFLQNYSDQEDEDNETEDIVICSRTQNKPKSNVSESIASVEMIESTTVRSPNVSPSKSISPDFEILEEGEVESYSPLVSENENFSPIVANDKPESDRISKSSKIEENDNYSPDINDKDFDENVIEDPTVDEKNCGNFTPDNTAFYNKNGDELEETKEEIGKLELEVQERRENEKHVGVKRKKKNKAIDKSDKLLKNKRKKKVKRKRSTSTSEESDSSSSDRKKKKSKKSKQRKRSGKSSPVKKKRKTKKDSKIKKKQKDESAEESTEKLKKKRKHVDSSSDSDDTRFSKKSKKSKKKKKASKDSDSDENFQPIEKDDNEWEDIEESVRKEDKPTKTPKSKPLGLSLDNSFIIEIDDLEDNLKSANDVKNLEIELNIDKKYLQRNKDNHEPLGNLEPTLSDNILCLPKIMDIKKEPDWEYTPDQNENHVENDIFGDNNANQHSPQADESNVNKLPTYNSWESDEEEIETQKSDIQETALLSRSSNESLDLEIPLNIKPFKKRDVSEYDIFKEGNVEMKATIDTKDVPEMKLDDKSKINEHIPIPQSPIIETPKKGRWDRRDSVPKTPIISSSQTKFEPVEMESIVPDINPIKSAVLENEYEQFMKALTSNVSESNDSTKNSSNSSSAFGFLDVEPKTELKLDMPPYVKPEKTMFAGSVIILPKDVPLIPIPSEVKPIPVPSPKLKLEEIPTSILHIPPPNLASDTPKPSVDLVSPRKEENRLNTGYELNRRTSLDNAPLVSSTEIENKHVEVLASITLPSENDYTSTDTASCNTSLPAQNTDTLENARPDVSSASEVVAEKKEKPFVFVGMTLPSKKVLLDRSRVNLDDSDDEDVRNKSLQKLEELEAVVGTKSDEAENLGILSKNNKNVQQLPSKEQSFEQPKQRSPQHRPAKETNSRRSNSPKQGRHSPQRYRRGSPSRRRECSPRRHGSPRRRSPDRRYSNKSNTSPRRKREYSPKRRSISPRRRSISPRRRGGSPRRKRSVSPRRRGSPPRRRSISPKRRHGSPRRRIASPRRSVSPRDRHSSSPRRKRFHSPRGRMDTSPSATNKRRRSKSPNHFTSSHTLPNRPKSPPPMASPLQGPKRSVADSTISDDLLPQPTSNYDEHIDSPIPSYHSRVSRALESPKRMPLDVRINEVLGIKAEPKTTVSSTYDAYAYQHEHYHQNSTITNPTDVYNSIQNVSVPKLKGSFVQVGNMVQIVPSEMPIKMDIPPPQIKTQQTQKIRNPPLAKTETVHQEKPKIVQVGNMLQIVPTTLPAQEIVNAMPEVKKEIIPVVEEKVTCDKPQIEIPIKLKTAESRAEKENRRKERELRRAEKEKKRKEREKKRQVKLKQKTEEMIKRALQLEAEDVEDEEEAFNETPMQWPPLSVAVPGANKEVGKSILVQAGVSKRENKLDKRKIVQFADGVKPGEGTSPSGGEELMSPPPTKKLPKEKRYKKTKLFKAQKKKVKVKVIKKLPLPLPEESDEDDDLPPPSPPPGSPPPHIFPPRVKVHTMNNVRTFLPNMVQGHQNQPQLAFTPPINLLMGHQSAIHQPPPLPTPSTIVMGHHGQVTPVPPLLHHGASSAVPTLLHHGSVPAVITPMHHGSVPIHHGIPHHSGTPTGSHGLSHPRASFHY